MNGDHLSTALAPLRQELLAQARADARRVLAQADRESEHILARAREQVEVILDAARGEAAVRAEAVRRAEAAAVRTAVRAAALNARREAYEEFRREVHDAVQGFRDAPDYPLVLSDLTARARATLGSGVPVREDPSGGVVATDSRRVLRCTLTAFAEQAVAAFGAEVAALWAP